MARTKAQVKTPQKTYGGQTHRGDLGERRAAAILREERYSVELSPLHRTAPRTLSPGKARPSEESKSRG